MLALAIDTSTSAGSVGLADDGCLSADLTVSSGQTHSERLLCAIEAVMAASGVTWSGVDLLAVACGPGSFTGLRIGMATAKGLALALSRPVTGFSTLETIAFACAAEACGSGPRAVLALLNAGRGEVYRGLYRDSGDGPQALRPEAAVEPAEALAGVPGGCIVCGDGFEAYRDLMRPHLPLDAVLLRRTPPIGSALARRAIDRARRTGLGGLPPPTPNYLRLSDAEIHFRG